MNTQTQSMIIREDADLKLDVLASFSPLHPVFINVVDFTGGSVFDMRAFINELTRFPQVIVRFDGAIAGTGFLLMTAATRVLIGNNGMFCYLEPVIATFGSKEEMTAAAKTLDDINQQNLNCFKSRFNFDVSPFSGKWLSAKDLKKHISEIEILENSPNDSASI
ncbi:hypothetical protein QTU67_003385 [Vibrio cholerae]|nr:hypothetical protein [Vibrio cholerae]